jgi:hypothetical protein
VALSAAVVLVEARRRRDTERTGQRRRQIGENIRVQICCHDGVERAGFSSSARTASRSRGMFSLVKGLAHNAI